MSEADRELFLKKHHYGFHDHHHGHHDADDTAKNNETEKD
jgi:hypothetical protein